MPRIGFIFNKPETVIGEIIVFFTADPFSHSAVVLENTIYSSEMPIVRTYPIDGYDRTIAEELWLPLMEDEYSICLSRATDLLGKFYDFSALFDWVFYGKHTPKAKRHYYCHNFCRNFLVDVGLLQHTIELVTARQLITEIKSLQEQRINFDSTKF